MIFLDGDAVESARWIPWAKRKLAALRASMRLTKTEFSIRTFPLVGVSISIKASPAGDSISISSETAKSIIICYVGDTTGDFSSKRFYTDSGKELGRDEVAHPYSPPGWALKDDGLYGPSLPTDADPWNMTYAYNPGGLGIPDSGSGISPKRQAGKSARYILDGAIEDETFEAFAWRVVWAGPVPAAYDYTYNFVRQVDSLTYAPYSMYGPKPFFAKYVKDHVVTMIVPWAGYESTFTWDAYRSDNFRDKLPKVHKIWKVAIADGARSATEIDDYGDDSDAVIGAAGYLKAATDTEPEAVQVRILRTKTQDWGPSKMAEPISDETYDLTANALTLGTEFHRCADPANELCYFYDANTDSGTPDAGSTIGNDVRVPHSIDFEGKQSYVRIQKSGLFDSVNTGLYCGDALVEESGWEAVIKPHDPERRGPLLIRNTRYRILHAHGEKDFQAVVYSKTKYVTHSDELLDYTVTIEAAQRQVRKTMIQSYTTYHLSVNGVITDLGYSNYRREYRLTAEQDVYAGPAIPAIFGHMVELPWVDCGYDAAGNPLAEDNSCVTRIDTNSAKGQLFVGFDVFPVAYRHDLAFDAHDNLTLTFDEGVVAFPPSSDARYPNVKDRKWMLFKKSGELVREITPPKKLTGGHVNRINGLAFIGA